MSFSDDIAELLAKKPISPSATAIPATVATDGAGKGQTVARIAGIAVATAQTQKNADPLDHPAVRAALAFWPGAEVVAIRKIRADFEALNDPRNPDAWR